MWGRDGMKPRQAEINAALTGAKGGRTRAGRAGLMQSRGATRNVGPHERFKF